MANLNKCEPKVVTCEYHRDSAKNIMSCEYHTGLAETAGKLRAVSGGNDKTLNFERSSQLS